MSELYGFAIAKSDLERLTRTELTILLCGGKILNELNVFTQLLHFGINAVKVSAEGPEKLGALTNTMALLRVLAGHTYEAHSFIRSTVRIRDFPDEWLDNDFRSRWSEMNIYFGTRNIVAHLRNKLAFHTDAHLMLQAFTNAPVGYEYEMLIGDYPGHNVFHGSETLMSEAMPLLHGSGNWEQAIHAAFNDTTRVTGIVGGIIRGLVGIVLHSRLGLTIGPSNQVAVDNGPPIDTVILPFYCSLPIGNRTKDIPQEIG